MWVGSYGMRVDPKPLRATTQASRPLAFRGRMGLSRRVSLSMVFLFAVGSIGGCAPRGPRITRTSHLAYNEAVQVTGQQELLLNLVRLRYTDAPEFLAISSIAAQMSFDVVGTISGDFGRDPMGGNTALVTPGASVGYSERPTISFTPERGAEFNRQLVAPIDLNSFYLLTEYGWNLARVLRLVVNEMNGVSNTIGRESNRPEQTQSLRSFAGMANRLGALHQRGVLDIAAIERHVAISAPLTTEQVSANDLLAAAEAGLRYEYREDPPSYVLTESEQAYVLDVRPSAWADKDLRALSKDLALEPKLPAYDIDRSGQPDHAPEQSLRIDTRSVLGAMAYLSQAVEVPAEHVERRLVTPNPEVEAVLSDLLKVRVAERTPSGTTLSVRYRGYSFYIEESDLSSKRTMGLLESLMRLQISTGGAQNVPVLTLPVSQ